MARHIRYDAWSAADGTLRRVSADVATWTSPWCEPGFAFTELVASWSATTPRGTWVEVAVQARGEPDLARARPLVVRATRPPAATSVHR